MKGWYVPNSQPTSTSSTGSTGHTPGSGSTGGTTVGSTLQTVTGGLGL
jgi:hypothetical protein